MSSARSSRSTDTNSSKKQSINQSTSQQRNNQDHIHAHSTNMCLSDENIVGSSQTLDNVMETASDVMAQINHLDTQDTSF